MDNQNANRKIFKDTFPEFMQLNRNNNLNTAKISIVLQAYQQHKISASRALNQITDLNDKSMQAINYGSKMAKQEISEYKNK